MEKCYIEDSWFFQRNVSVLMLYTRTLVASIDQDQNQLAWKFKGRAGFSQPKFLISRTRTVSRATKSERKACCGSINWRHLFKSVSFEKDILYSNLWARLGVFVFLTLNLWTISGSAFTWGCVIWGLDSTHDGSTGDEHFLQQKGSYLTLGILLHQKSWGQEGTGWWVGQSPWRC